MRGYGREEVEDYDDYDMGGEYQDEDVEEEEGEEYEEEGEEYEEEEARQPTQEEMEYLELRQRLKDSIRRKRKQNGAGLSSKEKEKSLPYNNFGSFFGPSQPVISQRVIQESKSLLENQNLVSKMLSSNQSSKKNSASNSAGSKPGQRSEPPKATSQLKRKVEKLKVARDYSFLSDDAELPLPAKEPPPRNVSARTSEARSAQIPPKGKPPLGSNSNSGRNVQGIHEERKSVPLNGQMHSKAGSSRPSSASKPNVMSMDSKKQLGVSNGTGPGRPVGVSNGTGPGRPVGVSNGTGPGRPVGVSSGTGRPVGVSNGIGRPVAASNGTAPGRQVGASYGTGSGRPGGGSNGSGPGKPVGVSNGVGPARPKTVPSKMPIAKMEKKISAPVARNLPPSAHKAAPSKMHGSDSRQQLELKKRSQEHSRDKNSSQRPVISSKPQLNKQAKQQVLPRSQTPSNVQRPKKKQLSEDDKALMMIRNMFHTDRYPVCDDDDDSDMEANWDEIMMEEKRRLVKFPVEYYYASINNCVYDV
ncbi:hypothetical protein PTKIN_Ptkin07bG0254000 [Pterospermum kingtungense]